MSRQSLRTALAPFVIVLSLPTAVRAQDECGGAAVLTLQAPCVPISVDATGATQSQPAILCNGHTSPQANDLWFTFEANGTATTVQVDSPGSFDAVVEVFSGACGSLTSIGCTDEAYPPSNGTLETITLPTVPGSDYYVRVYAYWLPAPSEFMFSVCAFDGAPPPANDLCTNVTASELEVGTPLVFTGNNTDALDSEGLGAPSVWEAFTIGTCANVTIDLCGTAPAFTNVFDALYLDCSLTDTVPASSVDAEACGDDNHTLTYQNLAPGTYYYAVRSDAGSIGAYTLTVEAAACTVHCTAEAGECDEYIARVICSGLDHSTDCSAGGYADHTDQVVTVAVDSNVEIAVHNGPSFYNDDQVFVWADWDRNLSFLDAGEVTVLTSADDGATFTGTIVVPADAELGLTRMRIRMLYEGAAFPCDSSQYGEVEDYTLNVQFGVGIGEPMAADWSVFPNPGDGDLTLRYAAPDALVDVDVLDVSGRIVRVQRRYMTRGEHVALPFAGVLAPGTYVLRLTSALGRSEQRIVVR